MGIQIVRNAGEGLAPGATGPRVLVVDEDRIFRQRLCRDLHTAGYDPVTLSHWRAVIDFLEGPVPLDALITELNLRPGAPSGLSLARLAGAERKRLPVLFITHAPDLAREAAALGPVTPKGFGTAPVIEALNKALARRAPAVAG